MSQYADDKFLTLDGSHNSLFAALDTLEIFQNSPVGLICSFVRLFVLGFSSHSKNFHSYGDFTIANEGLQILTYTRHSWPLSSDVFSACHTYCNSGHMFIMVITEDP